jgi:hypothetical protein
MNLHELVRAILAGDLLAARQWVADAQRPPIQWSNVERPLGLNETELIVAAGLTELLAERAGMRAPSWTSSVGASPTLFVLDPGLQQMPRTFHRAKIAGPIALRNRNLIATAEFLEVR